MCCFKCGVVLTEGEVKESHELGNTPMCYSCILYLYGNATNIARAKEEHRKNVGSKEYGHE